MKKKTTIKKNRGQRKLYVVMGSYDQNGQYHERRKDNVVLNNLPKDVIREVSAGHDITIQLLPKCGITVFAKSAKDMAKYLDSMGANQVEVILEAFSKYNDPDIGWIWGTYDFDA